MTALEVRGLSKSFGGLRVTDDVSLSVEPGEMHALIGPNGAGKTTLISLIAGELRADSGRVLLLGRDVTALGAPSRARAGLGRSFQIIQLFGEFSAATNVAVACLAARPMGVSLLIGDARRDPSLLRRAEDALTRVGLGHRAHAKVADLSHGERRLVELALALARGSRVLLLDEPMAGLGADETRAMTRILHGLKGGVAILLVEHDMDAVFALADRVTVLVRGRIIACDAPERVRADDAVRAAYLGTA